MNSLIFRKSESVNDNDSPRLLLAHGAGAPADSPFMESLAWALSSEGVITLLFEFPYMAKQRENGRKRPPDRQPALLEHFRKVIDVVGADPGNDGNLFIGGKSMGGRMASLLAAQPDIASGVKGVVCFGYPFHPPGKSDRWRTDHFRTLQRPVQIIQGTRDAFGRRAEVEPRGLDSLADLSLAWLEGGDHDFKPLARQPETHQDLIRQAAAVAADFMRQQR